MNKEWNKAITKAVTNAHKYIVNNAMSFAGDSRLAPFEDLLDELRGIQTLMLIERGRAQGEPK
jgi:hypothetical protein